MKTIFHVIPRGRKSKRLSSSDRGNLPATLKIATLIARNDKGRGFTLAEILVVMAITAIVGTILVVIFTNTLRGSNKAQILAVIKQNGQAVLENMDKTIRNADNVACVTLSGNTLVIIKNGTYSRYRFYPKDNSIYCGTNNGCIQQDNPVRPDTGDKSVIKVFIDSLCTDDTDPLVGSITLTDTNTQTGVSVECPSTDCITFPQPVFTRGQSAGYRDLVTVKFNMKPGTAAPSVISSQIDPVVFQTTIGLR